MSNPPGQRTIIEQVIANAETTLQTIDDPSPFSARAFQLLKIKISQYVSDLVTESVKVASRYRADMVSAFHIERASEYLVATTSRRYFRHLGTLGGILLGAAISNILAMTSASQYTGIGTILSAGLGIIGAFLIALHIAKD